MAATVAAESFQLAVDSLDGVGRRQRAADGVGVVQEGEVVGALLPQFGDKGGIVLIKTLTEFFKQGGADLGVPSWPSENASVVETRRRRPWRGGFWRCAAYERR